MNKLTSIAFASSLLVAVACGDVVQPGDADDGADGVNVGSEGAVEYGAIDPVQPKIIAKSCADLRAQDPRAEDDDYTLYVGRDEAKPFTAYCQDMASTPRDYLKLENVQGAFNFSQYTMGGAANGWNVRTYYFYLRFDPETLTVDTSDQTFTLSEGALNHSATLQVTSMPYGVAMACGGDGLNGLANINLRGTHFAVADTFAFVGNGSFGVIASDADMTNIDIEGGGFCGWMAPVNTSWDPMNTAGGVLQLAYAR